MKKLCDKCDRNFYHECDEVCKEEEAYQKGIKDGKAEAIDECARIMSRINSLCRICPADCDFRTSCKEQWQMFLQRKLKEKNND